MAAIVIADASPLIAMARVNGLGWLEALFGQVLVTEEVMAEVLSGGYPAREEPIQAAINFSTGGFGDSSSISPPAARQPARHNAHLRRCRRSHGRGVSDSLSGTGFLLDTSVLI